MYCENCGKKIADDSKFCSECGKNASGGGAFSSSAQVQTKRGLWRHWWFRAIVYIICIILVLPTVSLVIVYFAGVAPYTYTHPVLGFTFNYPKTLSITTSSGTECPTKPCAILLMDPSYTDYASNWIFVIPISQMKVINTVKEAIASFNEDVEDGWATTKMINDIKMYSYTNEPDGKNKGLISIYQMLGLDSSKQQSIYAYITDDSIVIIGFRKPPEGAPTDYKDYLHIKSWEIPAKK